MQDRETKSASVTMRVRPTTKERAELMAAEDDRSLASWFERFVAQEWARRHGDKKGKP